MHEDEAKTAARDMEYWRQRALGAEARLDALKTVHKNLSTMADRDGPYAQITTSVVVTALGIMLFHDILPSAPGTVLAGFFGGEPFTVTLDEHGKWHSEDGEEWAAERILCSAGLHFV